MSEEQTKEEIKEILSDDRDGYEFDYYDGIDGD